MLPISTKIRRGTVPLLSSLLLPLLALSCTAQVGDGPQGPGTGGNGDTKPGSTGGSGSGSGSASGSGSGSGSGSASGSGGAGAGPVVGSGGSSTVGTGGGGIPMTSSGGMGPPPGPKPVATESAGLMPLLRLTHREYSNTMTELLGDTSTAGATFETDNAGPAGFLAPSNVATENARQYSTAAEKLAAAAFAGNKLGIPTTCTTPANAAAETTCATQFIADFGGKAYRRPLVKTESDDLLALFQSARTLGFTFPQAITKTTEAILQSPNLLYHWEVGDQPPTRDPENSALVSLTAHQLASRLSYLLWESPPDTVLLDAAVRGQLATAEGLKTQAMRLLLDDRRARKALFNFHRQWLHIENLDDLVPGSDFGSLLGQELEAFVSSVFVGGDGTLRTLLTAPYTFVNATTAKEYGLTATGTAMTKVALNPAQRQGVLMQIPFLRANGNAPPVFRGLVVYKHLLCGTVPAPPPEVPEVSPNVPNSTTRERFAQHGQLACAKGCHALFDPWGFSFENFDSLGHFRTMENGKTVDPSGVAQPDGTIGGTTPQQKTIAFKNAGELVNALAASDEVSWCTSKQWARYMLGRKESDADMNALMNAYTIGAYGADRATARPFSVRDFLVAMVGTKAFRFRQPAPGETL